MYDFNNKSSFNSYSSNMNKENNKKDINSIYDYKYDKKIKSNFKKTIFKRNNNVHNDFGRQLTYNKKISSELDSLPSNIHQLFRKSLDKYKFNLEVYVPQSMRISKKEYLNKDYMINTLVKTNFKIESEKNKILNLSKETRKFSTQYKLVKEENTNKQKDYLLNLEKEYMDKNFKDVKYSKEDNIFTPSFLLDTNSGNNLNSDGYKYGLNNDFYLDESKRDKHLLQKFYDVIYKIRNNKEKEETNDDLDGKDGKLSKIKKEVKEEMKIRNMNRKEYFYYSQKLKKEINKVKKLINDSNKIENLYSERNNKLFLELSNEKTETEENNSKIKNIKNNFKKNINLIDKIPKLQLNNIIPKVNKNKKNKKESKSSKLNQLYITLTERNYSKDSDAPYKQIAKYFKKYNPITLPIINKEKGSNIHGLAESVQKAINSNNAQFSKLNDDLKKDMFNELDNIENKDETKNIINVDKKILGLHYEFVDNLLSNKKDSYLKSFKE